MDNYFHSTDIGFIASQQPTPILVLDAAAVRRQLTTFMAALPDVIPFYSVKTNPHPFILDTLQEFDSHYDVATLGEIKLVLSRGVPAGRLLYTHPTKSAAEISAAVALGVSAFTLDSLSELERLVELAPTSHYFVRVLTTSNSSLYDYKRKFGASLEETEQILRYAADNTVAVTGLSFMVGSQSMSVQPWTDALVSIKQLFATYYDQIPSLRIVNLGSGFPLQYAFSEPVPSLAQIADVINAARVSFPADVTFVAEPGRYIVGPAGAFLSRVDRRLQRGDTTWLYTDVNAYSGLIEIIESGGKFRYPISSDATGDSQTFAVAGKTLDPDDLLGSDVSLPAATDEGSLLTIGDAGAYSTSFFTDYHSLPKPGLVYADSQYSGNVELTTSGMQISGIRAKRALSAGEIVFQVTGYFVPERTRTTFQIDHAQHIEPTLFGAFLNHSCDPNVGVRTNRFGHYDIIARRDIQPGDDIAADYAMFEYQTGPMSLVDCLCGSPRCRGRISGYKDLSDDQKASYAGLVASYLAEAPADTVAEPTPLYA